MSVFMVARRTRAITKHPVLHRRRLAIAEEDYEINKDVSECNTSTQRASGRKPKEMFLCKQRGCSGVVKWRESTPAQ